MNPKEPSGRASPGCLRLFLIALMTMIPTALWAAVPSWWSNPAFTTSGTEPAVSGSAADYGAANQGEVKNLAVTAVNELDYDLAQFGGAGPALDSLAASLSATSAATNDYAAVTLGQLKFLTQPFYDRLLSLGYYGPPLSTGTAMTSGTYPWVLSGNSANDYGMANIGQTKYLFSFDVTYSTAGDGLPDWWLIRYFGGLTVSGTAINPDGFVAWSGTQVTILQAFQNGWNPIDFYNGLPPTLTIVSGNDQTGPPGGFVPAPLVVSVTDSNGNPIESAPVTFTVTSGSGSLQPSSGGTPGASVTTFTDYSGSALMYFQLSSATSSSSQVTVTTGTGSSFTSGTFTAYSDNGTGVFQSPFAPTNVIGTVNSDGSLTLTWTNNTNNETAILIEQLVGGTWEEIASLPPGTTSYTITSPGSGPYRVDPQTPTSPNTNPSANDFVPIPVQNYAAIDVSGSTTSSAVTMIALDDSNNMAFAYIGISGSGPIANTWVNGVVTSTNTAPFPSTLDLSSTVTYQASWSTGCINASGSIYGTISLTSTCPGYSTEFAAVDCGNSSASYMAIPSLQFGDFASLNDYLPNGAVSGFWDPIFGSTANGLYGELWNNLFLYPDLYYISQSGTTTIFIGAQTSGSYTASSTFIITSTSFQPIAVNDNGAAIGYTGTEVDPTYGTNNVPVFWPGSGSSFTGLTPITSPIGINDANQVIGTGTSSGLIGYLWTSGSGTQAISQLVPAVYQGEISNIIPINISGTNANGTAGVIVTADYPPSPGAASISGTFLLTLASGTNPSLLQQVSFAPDVNFDLGGSTMNAQGLIAGRGTTPATSATAGLVQVPVQFTGTDANPFVDTGTVSGTASGFDGYTNPHWLMVPEFGSNSAKAKTPASPSFTVTFTGTTADPNMSIAVSPSNSNITPQTIAVSVSHVSGTYSSEIAVGVLSIKGIGGELHIDVKQYQLKTVAISVFAQQSGTNPLISSTNAPTASALQAYLNQVYGPQTNTYFFVVRSNYAINFDTTNTGTVTIDSTPGSPGGPQMATIRSFARNSSYDFNLYYVPNLNAPNSTGWSFPNLYKDAIIGGNSGSYTNLISAHELGHLFGLHHPQDPGPQHDPTAPLYDLMQHSVSGSFLDHLQWDIVNPYNPHAP